VCVLGEQSLPTTATVLNTRAGLERGPWATGRPTTVLDRFADLRERVAWGRCSLWTASLREPDIAPTPEAPAGMDSPWCLSPRPRQVEGPRLEPGMAR